MSDQGLLNKLEQISFKFDEIGKQMVDPEIISDMKRYVGLNREYKELSEIVKVYHSYKDILANIESAKSIIQTEKDPEFKEMARAELEEFQQSKVELEAYKESLRRQGLLEDGFCDFAFGSAQNDKVGGILRNNKNYTFNNFDYS